MKKHIRTIGVILLAVICLIIAFRNVDPRALLTSLRQANYWWLIPALILVEVAMVFRALRWRCLLSPTKIIGFMDLFSAMNICFMANNFLPARAGEFIRAVLIGKKHKTSISTVLATVVLERIFDAMCVVAIFLILLFTFSLEQKWKTRGMWLAAVYILFMVLLVVMRIYSKPVQRVIHRILSCFSSGLAHKFCNLLDSFLQGLNVLKDWRQVVLIAIYTALTWGTIFSTYYFICYAFHVHMPIPGYLLLMCFLVIAVMAPIPGYWGSFHVACREALQIFKYSSAVASSCAIVAHGAQFILVTVVGLLCLRYEKVSFGELKKREKEAEEEIEHLHTGERSELP